MLFRSAGRDLKHVREQVRGLDPPDLARFWREAAQRWDRYGLEAWDFGDLPDRALVSEAAGFPVHAFPGLHFEAGDVNRRLFRRPEEAVLVGCKGGNQTVYQSFMLSGHCRMTPGECLECDLYTGT